MYTGFKHTHVFLAILLILLLLVKAILLVFGKTETLRKIRAKTKVPDMILGILIIVTGGYMLYQTVQYLGNDKIATYFHIKLVVTLVAIPLGIIAFKKENKALAVLTFLAFVYVYGIAETKSWNFKKNAAEAPVVQKAGQQVSLKDVKALYMQQCSTCHGEDGKLGQLGATDLTETELTKEEIIEVIRNGRGAMPGFSEQLSETEIEALANYVQEL